MEVRGVLRWLVGVEQSAAAGRLATGLGVTGPVSSLQPRRSHCTYSSVVSFCMWNASISSSR